MEVVANKEAGVEAKANGMAAEEAVDMVVNRVVAGIKVATKVVGAMEEVKAPGVAILVDKPAAKVAGEALLVMRAATVVVMAVLQLVDHPPWEVVTAVVVKAATAVAVQCDHPDPWVVVAAAAVTG